ncbi:hypothetical protein BJ944DRAFT_241705 [Cunninghamella echinulata]|nr:hypothetical protein BJ944DRAFT_241705 [Cunninghamella echinulata]
MKLKRITERLIITADHTATLVKYLVYIVGNSYISVVNGITVMDFCDFTTCNTIYGDLNNFRTEEASINIYYVYNIATNYLVEAIALPRPELNFSRNILYSNARFGHYVFEYHTFDTPSDNADILYVQDLYKLTWNPLLTINDISISQLRQKDPLRTLDSHYNNGNMANTRDTAAIRLNCFESQRKDAETNDHLVYLDQINNGEDSNNKENNKTDENKNLFDHKIIQTYFWI